MDFPRIWIPSIIYYNPPTPLDYAKLGSIRNEPRVFVRRIPRVGLPKYMPGPCIFLESEHPSTIYFILQNSGFWQKFQNLLSFIIDPKFFDYSHQKKVTGHAFSQKLNTLQLFFFCRIPASGRSSRTCRTSAPSATLSFTVTRLPKKRKLQLWETIQKIRLVQTMVVSWNHAVSQILYDYYKK